ncbi:membrane protein insertion efficiency factor YidD [bacterium]|nr:membrane protein insertion efficiency factor YidD [bacterium]MBU1983446.1 membrane protein insertion efficiency factor YidD [bacterium]
MWILKRLIDAYAVTLGPHFGGRCRFTPSCSEYAREAIETLGPLRGLGLTMRRLVKCGPWHKGGYDPVPRPHEHHPFVPDNSR